MVGDNLINTLSGITGFDYTEDERRVMQDAIRWSEIKPIQINNWVRNCQRLVKLIVEKKAGVSDVAWFWISLFAIFKEIQPHFEELAMFFLEPANSIVKQIKDIRALLTEEEMIFLDILRQEMSHPIPEAVRLTLKKARNGSVPGVVKNKYRGKEKTKIDEDIHTLLKSTSDKYNVPIYEAQTYIAYEFSVKIVAQITLLADSIDQLVST